MVNKLYIDTQHKQEVKDWYRMNSAGWSIALFVLLFFGGLIGFVIYTVQKINSESGGEALHSPPPVSKPSAPTPTPPEPAPVKKEEQKYVSIYEYTSTRPVRKCAYCDGENAYGAKICCICGNDIDS